MPRFRSIGLLLLTLIFAACGTPNAGPTNSSACSPHCVTEWLEERVSPACEEACGCFKACRTDAGKVAASCMNACLPVLDASAVVD